MSEETQKNPGIEPVNGFPSQQNLGTLELLDARFAEFASYAEGVKCHSPRTIVWYRCGYRNYRRYLMEAATLPADAFARRAFDLDEWVRWNHAQKVQNISLNSYWRAMRAFFSHWERRGAGPNPFRGARPPKVRSYVPKALGYDECARIMVAVRNGLWRTPYERALAIAVIGVMLYAGLRVGEVQRLLIQEVDLREGTIRVSRGKGQAGGKDRVAYIAPELLVILRDYVNERYRRPDMQQPPEFFATPVRGCPIGIATIRDIVARVSRSAQTKFTAHVLRHSFVTHLLRSGAPIHVVRDLAGHASITTTMGYLNVFDDDRRATLRKMQFGSASAREARRPKHRAV